MDDVARRQADRLAAAGYLTVSARPLQRRGSASAASGRRSPRSRRSAGRAFQDIEAARTWLDRAAGLHRSGRGHRVLHGRRRSRCWPRRAGSTPARTNYGMLPDEPDVVLAGACPVVASYGAKDRGLKGAAATLESHLDLARRRARREAVPDGATTRSSTHAPNGPLVLRPLLKIAGIGHPDPVAARTPGPGSRRSSASTSRPPTDREAGGPGPPGQLRRAVRRWPGAGRRIRGGRPPPATMGGDPPHTSTGGPRAEAPGRSARTTKVTSAWLRPTT